MDHPAAHPTLTGDDQHRPHSARLAGCQEASQLILGLEPAEAMQVDARLDGRQSPQRPSQDAHTRSCCGAVSVPKGSSDEGLAACGLREHSNTNWVRLCTP